MADARLQVTIDAVDNASRQMRSVEQNMSRMGQEARRVGQELALVGGGLLAGMTLAIKSTADGERALNQLGATTGQLRDTIGQALVPVVLALNEALKPVVASIGQFVKEHPRVVQAVALIAGGLLVLGTTLFTVGAALRAASAAFQLLGLSAAAAWSAVIGPAIAVIAVLFLVNDIATRVFKFLHLIPQDAKPLWELLGGAIGDMADKIMGQLIPGTAKFGVEFKDATGAAADGVQAVIDKILKLREAEEKAAEEALDIGTKWNAMAPGLEDFLQNKFGPQIDAITEKLVQQGLSYQEAWGLARVQVKSALDSIMSTIAAGLGAQGQGILEALRQGTISWEQAWVLLGGKIEDVIRLMKELNAVSGISEAAELTPWGASAQAAIAQNIADVAAGKFDEPAMQHGGIVTRPTRALIGEAGPEAVIPLTGGKGGGGMFNIYLQLDGRTIASWLGGSAALGEAARSS